jgi:hypothetical protein
MRSPLVVAVVVSLVFTSDIQASDPQLSAIMPRGIQRGVETVVTLSGARLNDAEEIFFYEPGFAVKEIKAVDANTIQATIVVTADCALGEHVAQVRTKSGISEYRTFRVGAFPVIPEKEPNTEYDEAQEIELNTTVRGIVTSEDVDYFAVNCTKGQRLSVEIAAMRLGQAFFDPYIAILDPNRFELSAVDDAPLVSQDAVASVLIPEDGRYVIEVRDTGYGGGGNAHYTLHVGPFPRSTSVFPAGGQAGQTVDFKFMGDAAGETTRQVALPAEGADTFAVWPQDDRGTGVTPHQLRVSNDPNAFEVEPNQDLATATPVEFPSALNGILAERGDIDVFKFTAKKGQVFDVECYAHRIQSPVDPVMHIYKPDNGVLASNDDSRGPDSYARITIPADGEYKLRVTDLLGMGGPEYIYRVELNPVVPGLSLGIPRVARYSQNRQRIYVPKGGRFATILSASRSNFGGELELLQSELPAGITMVAQTMAANMNTMPVVFEAAADAPLGGALVDFGAKLKSDTQSVTGRFKNRADYIISGPGQSLYVWKDVERLPVAVVDELPFKLEIIQPAVPIVRNGSMLLRVVATKKEGWDEAITLHFPFRPPGIGANSTIVIAKGQTEVGYPISANGKAAIGKWPIYALGAANVGGNSWTATQMAQLEVAEPYIGLTLQKSSVEQGQATEVVAEVQIIKELTGPAKVELLGLPHNVTTTALEITAETKELVFPITTKVDSPAGTHKNIFCRITVTDQNEPIVHARVGGTEIRVDKPLPKPVAVVPKPKEAAKPMPMPVAEAPKPAPKKRLTRLQKLRVETKERAAARAAGA